MRRFRFGAVITIVVTAASLAVPAYAASPIDDVPPVLDLDPHPDLKAVAQANGWTVEEAEAERRAADVVGAIASKVAAARPDVFVGSALAADPQGAPTLYVKGAADVSIRDLVASAEIKVHLADKQPYSLVELEARSHQVHEALAKAGYQNIVTGANITGGGVIRAGIGLQEGRPSEASSVLALIPAELRADVELTVSDESGFADTSAAYGGMWVTDGGANECTSGWTVSKIINDLPVFGVTTAGHCSGIDGIREPGVGIHSFPAQAEHRGAYGDVEWHTSNVVEEGLFYAGSSTIRQVFSLEPRSGISVNEVVCQYGRASNFRDCGLHVYDVTIECTLSGVYNNRLVQMNAITSTFGDSGGGWFYDNKAYGSQKGWCQNRDAWSVADLYDEALGVNVVIYE